LLKVKSLNVYRDDAQVLRDVSFEVHGRSITAIIGSNGAGKTTTLYTIAGILKQRSGTILYKGMEISNLPAYKRVEIGLSLVPEGRGLFLPLSVEENLAIGAYTRKAKEKFHETLELVFQIFPILKERRKQRASTLSGGEQQMLAIAKALMSMPQLLMLDEPSLGLAPIMVSKLFRTIEEINKQAGVTILLVEQDVYKSLQLASKVYVLENGQIVKEGTGDELLKDEKIKEAYLGL
jgi:branched-chain amino acid transport system ATP-binding protein